MVLSEVAGSLLDLLVVVDCCRLFAMGGDALPELLGVALFVPLGASALILDTAASVWDVFKLSIQVRRVVMFGTLRRVGGQLDKQR